ncbi:MAG: hypothetical protein LBK97_00985 [Prevotellaceae bacterium]|jgi:hypothetical protein|nr:hypothetical protein [Prevotellaceae bacterium]
MKTNKDLRKSGDDSRRGEYMKGKFPLKEKKLKRSIYDEIDEDEDIGYSNIRKKESVEDYFDYEDEKFGEFDDEFGEKFDFVDDEYEDFDD